METEEIKNIEIYTALRTWAGSCNFCTLDDYDRVMVLKSRDEYRGMAIRLCPTCQRELLEILKSNSDS